MVYSYLLNLIIDKLFTKTGEHNFYKDSSFNIPATSNSFKEIEFDNRNLALSLRPVQSKGNIIQNRNSLDDFKLVYKSPKYLNKKKAHDLESIYITQEAPRLIIKKKIGHFSKYYTCLGDVNTRFDFNSKDNKNKKGDNYSMTPASY
jgi:hypothetical protein